MRWHVGRTPRIGERRVRAGFLWWPRVAPTSLDADAPRVGRWLERALWVEYAQPDQGPFGPMELFPRWRIAHWADFPVRDLRVELRVDDRQLVEAARKLRRSVLRARKSRGRDGESI